MYVKKIQGGNQDKSQNQKPKYQDPLLSKFITITGDMMKKKNVNVSWVFINKLL
jgi:hypothetical protein